MTVVVIMVETVGQPDAAQRWKLFIVLRMLYLEL